MHAKRKRLFRIASSALLALLALGAVPIYFFPSYQTRSIHRKAIEGAIRSSLKHGFSYVQKKGGGIVNVDGVFKAHRVNMEWDELLIVKPYSDGKDPIFDSATRRAVRRSRIESREDICLLVFRRAGRLLYVVQMERGLMDFAAFETRYSRDSAQFRF
jgi:hypothetical protein